MYMWNNIKKFLRIFLAEQYEGVRTQALLLIYTSMYAISLWIHPVPDELFRICELLGSYTFLKKVERLKCR